MSHSTPDHVVASNVVVVSGHSLIQSFYGTKHMNQAAITDSHHNTASQRDLEMKHKFHRRRHDFTFRDGMVECKHDMLSQFLLLSIVCVHIIYLRFVSIMSSS